MGNDKPGIEFFNEPSTGKLLTLVVRNGFRGDKYNFLTAAEAGLQLGVNSYRAGENIQPHMHVEREKIVLDAAECIVVKEGQMILYIFDSDKKFVAKTTLNPGDVSFQSSGGHGFHVTKDTQIIEVKQGPYGGDKDKNRFDFTLE